MRRAARRSPSALPAAGGVLAAAVAVVVSPHHARAAFDQTWPAFALVTGLLPVGVVAADDGLFESAGAWLGDLPGGGVVLFVVSMIVVAGVTVVLNLDTAVVFLTPVLVHAARRRSLDEAAFAYGTVFMCNAAVTVTGAGVWLAHRRGLRIRSPRGTAPIPPPGWVGVALVVLAAVLVVALHDPAIPVLALGIAAASAALARRRLVIADLLSVANPGVLLGLLGLAVGLGTLARGWTGPRTLVRNASPWEAAGVAALASIAINNLPAAVLMGSRLPAHPRALLLGLNVGPNLAVSGSLCAVLWLQMARRERVDASPARYSRIGAVLVPLSLAAALAASARLAPRGL